MGLATALAADDVAQPAQPHNGFPRRSRFLATDVLAAKPVKAFGSLTRRFC